MTAGAFPRKLRQAKPGRGGSRCSRSLKLLDGAPRDDPVRQRLATSRNRVLRGPRATSAAKRTQGVGGPRCKPRNESVRGADAVFWAEGNIGPVVMPDRPDPPGSQGAARPRGLPRNLGEFSFSPVDVRWATGDQPRPARAALVRAGAKTERTTGTAERRTTKRSGTGNEKSEPPIVPMKRENAPQRIPWREGEGRSNGTAGGKDVGDLEHR